jgi:hypothetical protein
MFADRRSTESSGSVRIFGSGTTAVLEPMAFGNWAEVALAVK